MGWKTIEKPLGGWEVAPNLPDYDRARVDFDWEEARRELLDGLPGGGLNIAHEAVVRHAATDNVAIRWLGPDGSDGSDGARRELTYADLDDATSRFANVLDELGVRVGDTVFALCGRVPDLYVAALGTLKHRSVFCPLFSAFGPEPIRQRCAIGAARVLMTTRRLYERRVAALRADLPALEHVLLVDAGSDRPEGTHSLPQLLEGAASFHRIGPTDPEDAALLHFTSGTTGAPKGALHVHAAVLAHAVTGRYVLDLHPGDVYWCTADPGWVTGTSYGIVAPLVQGVTTETGGIMIANYRSMDVKPGSMGCPLPGIDAAILRRSAGGDVVCDAAERPVVEPAGVDGELALRRGWPSMFRGYVGEDERYRKCFVGAGDDVWYRTGDLAHVDDEGWFWFVGRGDDIIKSAGHLIGPFEVESVLMEHPAVAEAGVIGIPDPVAGEVVKGLVSLEPGYSWSDSLGREIVALARKRLGPAVAPRQVAFNPGLPKTKSGKIMRRLLRARELGLPEGDLSTLESREEQ